MGNELTIERLREYSTALHTQYQLHGDYSISGRASYEAPTIEQMSTIREAHLSIIPIVKQLLATMQREEKLREALERIRTHAAATNNLIERKCKIYEISQKALASEYRDNENNSK